MREEKGEKKVAKMMRGFGGKKGPDVKSGKKAVSMPESGLTKKVGDFHRKARG